MGQQGKGSGVPFSLDVPPHAFDAEVTITITETTLAPPATFVDYSPVYRVAPSEGTSAFPILIVVPWGNRDGAVSGSLSVYTAEDENSPFERVPDSYINAGFMQASVRHFGLFFAGYPKSGAELGCP
jgi:hypothetical protein